MPTNQNKRYIHVICVTSQNGGRKSSLIHVKLETCKNNVKRFEVPGIFYAKHLNERVVRAKVGISVDIQFFPDLCISPLPSVTFCYISRVFSNDRSVLSKCTTRLRRLLLL